MLSSKIFRIILNAIPITIMIGLILVVANDYYLTLIYIAIILVALVIKYDKNDFSFMLIGFFVMLISETIFISTGVEKFERNSLFGLMPLWLPFLWAYSFVAIKRTINILEKS